MNCHYFKQNAELYGVQLYSSPWMGATASIYLTNLCSSLIIFLAFLPHYLHYGPRPISRGLQEPTQLFPNHFPEFPSLPAPPRFLHSSLFWEGHLNFILLSQTFLYDHQPSPHCTFSPEWGDLTRTYTSRVRETGKEHRWQRWRNRRNPQQWLYRCPQLWTHQFPPFLPPCFKAKSLMPLDLAT